MSNIIKSKYVYLNLNDTKVIDSNTKINQQFLVNLSRDAYKAVSEELAITGETFIEGLNAAENGAFIEGLNVAVIHPEDYMDNIQENLNIQCEAILDNARKEAEQIIEQAKIESKKTCELLLEEAKKKGYKDGMLSARSELEDTKKNLENQSKKLNDLYLEQVNQLEPEFCNILIQLLKKITGIIIEDKSDIIIHLIHNAIIHADKSKTYTLKISEEDYDFVLSKKDYISGLISLESAVFDIVMDKGLLKNQCFIETDSIIINCSLDVQLNNLIQDLKLLSV